MKVYHLTYEPSYHSLDIHIWVKCNLDCKGCYTNFETQDFGLADDPVAEILEKERAKPPQKFLSFDEVMELIKGKKIKYAVFMGTEAGLDPEMPRLARALHDKFGSYNVILTNGVKLFDTSDIDEIILSVKAYSGDIYRQYTGKSNHKVLDNFNKLAASGKKLQVETVFIPGLVETDEIENIAKYIASVDKNIAFRIDAYFRVPGCPWPSATKEQVEEAAERAKKHLPNVNCLTLDMKRIGDKATRIF
ncbi:MAG: radical SAM protein [Chloroflexi bacterium]|nr:radical SAM protein [Chloroflexota bacterium]